MQMGRAAVTIGVLSLVSLLMYFTSPTNGDFWWSDAPRHAMNGVFVKDLLRDLPFDDPKGYAFAQYAKFPALTILFYPPLFYFVSALFFAVFGFTHAVAQAVVAVHMLALGIGAFLLAWRVMPWAPALAVAASLLALPEIGLWGRQVMLEIPSFALALWSSWFLVRYTDRDRPIELYLSVLLLLCAVWTKLSLVFLAGVFALVLFTRFGTPLFRRSSCYIAAALFVIGLAPLIAITWLFGQANIQSVAGIADAAVPRWSVAGWTWYLRQLPGQTGWMPLAAGAVGLVLVLTGLARSVDRVQKVLLLAWFLVGYVFFSLIDLKEARHSVYLLLPVVIFAGIAISALPWPRVANSVSILAMIGVVTFGVTQRVPSYDGYREAVEFVAAQEPRNGIVVFSGKRDGSFIFNARALYEQGHNLTVIRADKLLLSISVRRELGVRQANFSEQQIADLLGRVGATYVVAQDDFWIDLDQMAKLQAVLRSDRFSEVKKIYVRTDFPQEDRVLRIYRNLGPVAEKPERLDLDLPIIGQKIKVHEQE